MKASLLKAASLAALWAIIAGSAPAQGQIATHQAGRSPWGPGDEIGTINMMSDVSRLDVLRQVAGGKVYDLGVDLFVGMPACCAQWGDPSYQIWLTHAPARAAERERLEKGVSLLEVLWLEDLARDRVHEFLVVASPLKLRGATGSPVRPLAIPIRYD